MASGRSSGNPQQGIGPLGLNKGWNLPKSPSRPETGSFVSSKKGKMVWVRPEAKHPPVLRVRKGLRSRSSAPNPCSARSAFAFSTVHVQHAWVEVETRRALLQMPHGRAILSAEKLFWLKGKKGGLWFQRLGHTVFGKTPPPPGPRFRTTWRFTRSSAWSLSESSWCETLQPVPLAQFGKNGRVRNNPSK